MFAFAQRYFVQHTHGSKTGYWIGLRGQAHHIERRCVGSDRKHPSCSVVTKAAHNGRKYGILAYSCLPYFVITVYIIPSSSSVYRIRKPNSVYFLHRQ
jgi:hypothetical protein